MRRKILSLLLSILMIATTANCLSIQAAENKAISEITITIPYLGLQVTMKNVPEMAVDWVMGVGWRQVKLYFNKDTRITFDNSDVSMSYSVNNEQVNKTFKQGEEFNPSDYVSLMWLGDTQSGTVMLSIVDVQYYEKNIAEGNTFTSLYDWEKLQIAPAEPGSIFTTQDIEVGIKLTWTGSSDAIGYRIYRSEDGGKSYHKIYEGGPTPTEFIDVNVKSNAKYQYVIVKLVARKGGGNPIGAIICFETGQILTETGGKVTETDVELLDDNEIAITTGNIRGAQLGTRGFLLMRIGDPIMLVNGMEMEIDPGRGTTPVILDGRTLMPIRAAIEAMDGTVDWSEAEQKVSLNVKEYVVEMTLGAKLFSVNGADKELDVPPRVINDRTMLPIRFVAENIGCEVAWIGSTQEVVVVYGMADTSQEPATETPVDNTGSTETANGTTTSADIVDGDYYIQAKNGLYITVNPDADDDKQTYIWSGGNRKDQRFRITKQSDGTYSITSAISNYEKAIDVAFSSSEAGANIVQWGWMGADNQKWNIVDCGEGYYKFVNKATGHVLDVYNNNSTNGTRVEQWYDNWGDGAAQRFRLIPIK